MQHTAAAGDRISAWRGLIGTGAALGVLGYALQALAGGAARPIWLVVSHAGLVFAIAVAALAARDQQGPARRPVRLLAAAIGLPTLHSILKNFLPSHLGYDATTGGRALASVLDLAGAGCAVLFAIALVRIRRSRAGSRAESYADAIVIAGVSGVLWWELLVTATGGLIVEGREFWIAIITTGALSAVTALVTLLMFAGAYRYGAAWLLAGAAVAGVVSAVALGLVAHQLLIEVPFVLSAFLVAAAVRHPSMRRLLTPERAAAPAAAGIVGRVAVLSAAVVVPAVAAGYRGVLVSRQLSTMTPVASLRASLPPAVAGIVITGIVSWRLGRLVVDRERAREALRVQARHDALTGLPNRTAVIETLEDLLVGGPGSSDLPRSRSDTETDARDRLAVLYLDLDGFKAVNDGFGHHRGDQVLVTAARRMSDVVRSGDLVGRLAGDEFVIVCPGPIDRATADALAGRVHDALAQPYEDAGSPPVRLGVSVGVVVTGTTTNDADVVDRLLRTADGAMYAAKRAGGGVRLASDDDATVVAGADAARHLA